MPKLNFFDMKSRKKFVTNKYKLVSKKTKKGVKYFAVTKSPSGIEAWRIVSKDFYDEYK